MSCADEAAQAAIATRWCCARTAGQRVMMLAFLRGGRPGDDVMVVVAGQGHSLPQTVLLAAIEAHVRG